MNKFVFYILIPIYSDKCSLVCAKDNQAYFFGKVKDGTRCYKDQFKTDVCIDGACHVGYKVV